MCLGLDDYVKKIKESICVGGNEMKTQEELMKSIQKTRNIFLFCLEFINKSHKFDEFLSQWPNVPQMFLQNTILG